MQFTNKINCQQQLLVLTRPTPLTNEDEYVRHSDTFARNCSVVR